MEVGATIVTIEAFAAGINPAAIPSKAEQRITPIKDISIHNIVNPQTKEIAKLIITAPFLVNFFIKKDHCFHKSLCENSGLFLNVQCSPFVSYTYRENRSPFMI